MAAAPPPSRRARRNSTGGGGRGYGSNSGDTAFARAPSESPGGDVIVGGGRRLERDERSITVLSRNFSPKYDTSVYSPPPRRPPPRGSGRGVGEAMMESSPLQQQGGDISADGARVSAAMQIRAQARRMRAGDGSSGAGFAGFDATMAPRSSSTSNSPFPPQRIFTKAPYSPPPPHPSHGSLSVLSVTSMGTPLFSAPTPPSVSSSSAAAAAAAERAGPSSSRPVAGAVRVVSAVVHHPPVTAVGGDEGELQRAAGMSRDGDGDGAGAAAPSLSSSRRGPSLRTGERGPPGDPLTRGKTGLLPMTPTSSGRGAFTVDSDSDVGDDASPPS